MANKGLAKDQKDLSILVTGGAGFIGSHTCVELIQRGYSVVIVDDLSNSSQIAVDRIRKICGIDADDAQLRFYKQNILDREALDAIFAENDVDAIIHFAGFKAVGESVQKPLEYYWNNIAGTLVLCDVARNHGVQEHRVLQQRDGVRRARVHPDHRGVPQARLHQPLRMDQEHARAGAHRPVRGRQRVERRAAALLQSHRRT